MNAIFYHAGCPVCITAEQRLVNMIDTNKVNLQIIHLGENPSHIAKAEALGVKSVPALVLENQDVLHINFGTTLEDVKDSCKSTIFEC